MKLPNGHLATVDERKIREYLLSHSHPIGRFKARVFASVGFRPGNWQPFAQALADLAATGDATLDRSEVYVPDSIVDLFESDVLPRRACGSRKRGESSSESRSSC
jgi:hypothetical protein